MANLNMERGPTGSRVILVPSVYDSTYERRDAHARPTHGETPHKNITPAALVSTTMLILLYVDLWCDTIAEYVWKIHIITHQHIYKN